MLGAAIPTVAAPWLDRFGEYLDPEHVSAVQRSAVEVGTWWETLRNHRTLWHGDFRLENLLFDARGGSVPVAVVDWQSAAAAPGVIDVSYFLGNSMAESEGETHERDLVTGYHQRLSSYGLQNYSLEECWRECRAHALFGLALTIPVSVGGQTTARADAMFRRHGTTRCRTDHRQRQLRGAALTVTPRRSSSPAEQYRRAGSRVARFHCRLRRG